MSDLRQYAPATERNRQPILQVLRQILPSEGTVLEIASGTGEHATFFAAQLPHLHWLPSEPQSLMRESIQAWIEALSVTNVADPLALDVSEMPWPVETEAVEQDPVEKAATEQATTEQETIKQAMDEPPIRAVVAINMIHIAPWARCADLMMGASRVLPSGGVLYLYGPYKRDGKHTAPSNEAFDQMLRDRNPEWGIRDLEAVVKIAQQHHLQLENTIPMPANNFSVIFRRL